MTTHQIEHATRSPEPWRLEWVNGNNVAIFAGEELVAIFDNREGRDIPNATLAAAAPELLSALASALRWVDTTEAEDASSLREADWPAQARLAIAKARGEEKL